MSNFIRGDQLAAALPWQLTALDGRRTVRGNGRPNSLNGPNGLNGNGGNGGNGGNARTETAEEAVNRARDEGFRHGLEVGQKQGQAAGEAISLGRNAELDEILGGMRRAVATLDDTIAAELIQLALAVARQVVCNHIEADSGAIVPVVREALHGVVAIVQHPRLAMHPADAEVIQREMAAELLAHNCRVHPDARMTRSSVRIEDAGYELDATLPTRWQRTIAALGLKDERPF